MGLDLNRRQTLWRYLFCVFGFKSTSNLSRYLFCVFGFKSTSNTVEVLVLCVVISITSGSGALSIFLTYSAMNS